jgi:transcriptional regulator with XRE-family HTH domain
MSTGEMIMTALDMLTPRQSRAARVLLGVGQEELARRAKVAKRTLMDFESGAREPTRATKLAIAAALQGSGAQLLEGEGVKLRPNASSERPVDCAA